MSRELAEANMENIKEFSRFVNENELNDLYSEFLDKRFGEYNPPNNESNYLYYISDIEKIMEDWLK
jgi:hypothetical protein